MAKKKELGEIFKQADFLRSNGFHDVSDIGLVVMTDLRISDFDNIRTNFRSDFFSVFLVQEGHLKGTLNRQTFELVPNDLLVISPHALKRVISIDKNAIVSGINFTLDFLVEIGVPSDKVELYDYFTSKYNPLWQLSSEDSQLLAIHFKQLSARLNNLTENKLFAKDLLLHTFMLVLYELAALGTHYHRMNNQTLSRKENLVLGFTNLLKAHFRHQRHVSQYAEQLFVTPKYLTETVKEITGKSAGEIIDDYVMLEAKVLLDNPKLSIAEIAEALHFSDQSFFGKFFKRHSGVSPKTFRLMNK